jgi:hypothetical protein
MRRIERFFCWLLGHDWDWVNPKSERGLFGVKWYCFRCRLELMEDLPVRCQSCGKRAVVWDELYSANQCRACAEVENANASQIYAGNKAVCQMYNVPLHCGIDEMGDDPRVVEGLAYARLFASAPTDIDWLAAQLERAREERGEAWDKAIEIVDSVRPFGGHRCSDPENAKICISCRYVEHLKAELRSAAALSGNAGEGE